MNKIVKNYIYNIINQLIVFLIPIITIPYVSRVLSPDGVGIYTFSESLAQYFVLIANLGFTYYAQREIAKHQDDLQEKSKIFFEIFILRSIFAILSILLFIVFLNFDFLTNKNILQIFIINIVAVLFDLTFFFQGNQEFGKIASKNVIIKVATTALIFIFIKQESDLTKYTLIMTSMILLGNFVLWAFLPKNITFKIKKLEIWHHLKPCLNLFIPTIATTVYVILDKTLLGAITKSEFEVGIYDRAQKLAHIGLIITTSLGTVLLPKITLEIKKKNKEVVSDLLKKSFSFILLISLPMALGIFAISSRFVPWFLGADFIKSASILKILCFLIIPISLTNLIGLQYLIPSNKDNKFNISVVSGAIANLIFNIPLIFLFKSVGAAIASLLAEFTVLLIQFIFIRKKINIKEYFNLGKNYIIGSILMFIILMVLNIVMPSNIIFTFIMIGIGVLFYFVFLLLIKDKMMYDNLKLILNKFKR